MARSTSGERCRKATEACRVNLYGLQWPNFTQIKSRMIAPMIDMMRPAG